MKRRLDYKDAIRLRYNMIGKFIDIKKILIDKLIVELTAGLGKKKGFSFGPK